jgi:hypothetical protein
MLHNGDVVEETATGRRGAIDNIGASVTNNQETQTNWRVYFSDGKEPSLKMFTKQDDFSLVECPHSNPEPGFYPSSSIMG